MNMHISDTYALQGLLEKLAEGRVTEVFQQQKMIKALLEAVNEDVKAFEEKKFKEYYQPEGDCQV